MDIAMLDVAYAEVNWGRWVARCPRAWCTNAMGVNCGQPWFRCDGLGGCGFRCDVLWPADPQAIELILRLRPIERTRNWLPGESVEDLIKENAVHGCVPPQWAVSGLGETRVICDIAAGRVVGGLLHEQLVAAGRREIGA